MPRHYGISATRKEDQTNKPKMRHTYGLPDSYDPETCPKHGKSPDLKTALEDGENNGEGRKDPETGVEDPSGGAGAIIQ